MIDRLLKPNGHRWTNAEIKTLMAMWSNDASLKKIAAKIGVSTTAIGKMVVRLRGEGIPLKKRTRGHIAGRTNNPWSQSQIDYLISRRANRATVEEIAMETGRTVIAINAMIQTLRREGVEVPRFGSGCHRKWNPSVAMAAMTPDL
jgi:biotin operon repressor